MIKLRKIRNFWKWRCVKMICMREDKKSLKVWKKTKILKASLSNHGNRLYSTPACFPYLKKICKVVILELCLGCLNMQWCFQVFWQLIGHRGNFLSGPRFYNISPCFSSFQVPLLPPNICTLGQIWGWSPRSPAGWPTFMKWLNSAEPPFPGQQKRWWWQGTS